MKKIDHNKFIIDDVFHLIDKYTKKKKKKDKKHKESVDFDDCSIDNEVEEIQQETNDNECYVIEINI